MWEQVAFTRHRELVYDTLQRSQKFHCPVGYVYEIDVTDLEQRIKELASPVSITSYLIKSTSLVIQRYPRLNHHLFRGLLGKRREVRFREINCNLNIERTGSDGEAMLFPVVIEKANERSLEDIHSIVEHYRTADLDVLPQIQRVSNVRRLPRLILKLLSFKLRSSPKFYEKYFGTYNMSSVTEVDWGPIAGNVVLSTAVGFWPRVILSKPSVVDDQIVIRRILNIWIYVDHYLLDGPDIRNAMAELKEMLETCALLEEG